jgi:hypothetical protein
MTQQTPSGSPGANVEAFVQKIRGHKQEHGLLLQLAGRLQHHVSTVAPEALEEAGPDGQRAVEALRTRLAQLSRKSEIAAREAAMNLGRLSKELQKQKADEKTARHFGPVLALLQKQVRHSVQKVQASKQAIQSLGGMIPQPSEGENSGEESSSSSASEGEAPHAAPKRARRKRA